MGRGPRRGVVGPVVSERVGDNAAAPGVEGLSSLALLALFFRFVIVDTKKKRFFCWDSVVFDYEFTGFQTGVNFTRVHLGSASGRVTPPDPYCRENAADAIPLLDAALMRGAEVVVGK